MRYTLDCRDTSSVHDCTVTFAADSRDEVLDATLHHAVTVHALAYTQQLSRDLNAYVMEIEEGIPA